MLSRDGIGNRLEPPSATLLSLVLLAAVAIAGPASVDDSNVEIHFTIALGTNQLEHATSKPAPINDRLIANQETLMEDGIQTVHRQSPRNDDVRKSR